MDVAISCEPPLKFFFISGKIIQNYHQVAPKCCNFTVTLNLRRSKKCGFYTFAEMVVVSVMVLFDLLSTVRVAFWSVSAFKLPFAFVSSLLVSSFLAPLTDTPTFQSFQGVSVFLTCFYKVISLADHEFFQCPVRKILYDGMAISLKFIQFIKYFSGTRTWSITFEF